MSRRGSGGVWYNKACGSYCSTKGKEKIVTISKSKRRSAKEVVPPIILGALGTVGVVALYLLSPGFQPIELVLLITVGFVAAGYTQGIVRGIMTIVALYIATGVGAIFYRAAAPYTGIVKLLLTIPLTGNFSLKVNINNGTLAFSFVLLTLLVWGMLEIAIRASFQDTSLPGLGVLDNLGGIIVHLIVGLLAASLLFNALGYGRLRPMHNRARLRPVFKQVIHLHYLTQSFWFPKSPPAIYIYDLNLPYGY
ncbi:MAG: hypothetical protein DRJ03_09695 [Chloroflexi bacterium]|nr:MAG: hypothetical protein DRI81_05880 [Chloroflexota bacterium]RLC86117.1 MAG: hypothetical protein DRJ03_09695 [Chloroflexota bacterium]